MTDPMEQIIADALDAAGIQYTSDFNGGNPARPDFYLPEVDVYIEVKRFHSPRIADQMSRAPNVIAVQGKLAVEWLAAMISARLSRDLSRETGSD